jgi:hypothetical protein
MFYLKLHKLKILNNRELLGKAEIQIMSFVNPAQHDFPDLSPLFTNLDASIKRNLIKEAATHILSSRMLLPIEKIKDNQVITFGDTGYVVYKSAAIPQDFSWLLLAVDLDAKTRDNAALVEEILTESTISDLMETVAGLVGLANPTTLLISKLVTLLSKACLTVFKNDKDDAAGEFLCSFIKQEHYPHGNRNKEDVVDMTGNMYVDYSIFGFEDSI